jgi:hypothetical protein
MLPMGRTGSNFSTVFAVVTVLLVFVIFRNLPWNPAIRWGGLALMCGLILRSRPHAFRLGLSGSEVPVHQLQVGSILVILGALNVVFGLLVAIRGLELG